MKSRSQTLPLSCDEPGMGGQESAAKSHEVRLSLLSRPVLGILAAFLVGSLALGLLEEPDSASGRSRDRLSGHDKLLEQMAYAPDGRTLISCGWDRKVRLWNVEDGRDDWGLETAALPHDSHVFSIAMTPDGQYLGSGGVQKFTIWSRGPEGGWERVLERQGTAHRAVAASPDSRTLAVGCSDGAIQLWDLASLKQTASLPGIDDEIREVAFSADGKLLVGSGFNGQLRTWRLHPDGRPEPHPFRRDSVVSFSINPSLPILATSSGLASESRIILWDLSTDREIVRVPGCELGNNIVAFSPEGSLLACGDKDNTIRLRDGQTGRLVTTLKDDLGWVKALAFSPDGQRIAFGGQDGSVKFRRLPGEATEAMATVRSRSVEEVSFKNSRREPNTVVTILSEKPCG